MGQAIPGFKPKIGHSSIVAERDDSSTENVDGSTGEILGRSGQGENGSRSAESSPSGSEDGGRSEGNTDEFLNVSDIPEQPKRRRGRPPGSGNKTTATGKAGTQSKKRLALTGKALATPIQMAHNMLSIAMKMPELQLSDDEADALGDAVADVAQYYNIAPDPKTSAWLGLVLTGGLIYAGRLGTIKTRLKSTRTSKRPKVVQPEQVNNVYEFPENPIVNGLNLG